MNGGSLTAPLNLRRHLRLPEAKLDAVPVLDLLLIGLFFALFNSQFLLPPGIALELPTATASDLGGKPVAAVLTVLPATAAGGEQRVLFRGEILPLGSLDQVLLAFLRSRDIEQPVLLVKMDKRSNIEQLSEIGRAARAAGFSAVQIAAEEEFRRDPLFEIE